MRPTIVSSTSDTRELSSEPDIAYGAIVTPQGIPISSHINDFDAARWEPLQPASTNRTSSTVERLTMQDELLHLEFPIARNGVLLGKFLVGISRQAPQKEFRRQLAMELLVVCSDDRFSLCSNLRRLSIQRAPADPKVDHGLARRGAWSISTHCREVR